MGAVWQMLGDVGDGECQNWTLGPTVSTDVQVPSDNQHLYGHHPRERVAKSDRMCGSLIASGHENRPEEMLGAAL